ncbi:MAG: BREX system ATP-binding domain-containing protein, partial [Chloroflexota bacterium]
MAGRQQEKSDWTEAIERRSGSRANAIHFIIGDYGFGKTLTLYQITQQYADDPEVLTIFMKMLSEDKVSKFSVDFIQRIFQSVPAQIFRMFTSQDIDALRQVYPEPARIFDRISLGDENAKLFLRGELSCTTTQLEKKLGIRRKIDRTNIAKEYLLGFLFLAKGVGINTLLLAVDEVEYVFSQMRGANISLVFNTLRALYDLLDSESARQLPRPPANMIFFLAISHGGWMRLSDLSQREQTESGPFQALMRRFGKIIELSPLIEDETRELIERRLRKNRVTGVYEARPLIPYDETFVGYVYSLSLGNPGEIVKYCDYALEEGLKEKASLLDDSFAKRAFIAHGLIVETD